MQPPTMAPIELPKRPSWALCGPGPPPGPIQPANNRLRSMQGSPRPQSRATSSYDACDTVRSRGCPGRFCDRGWRHCCPPACHTHTTDAAPRGRALSNGLHARNASGSSRYGRYGRSVAAASGTVDARHRLRDGASTCASEASRDERVVAEAGVRHTWRGRNSCRKKK